MKIFDTSECDENWYKYIINDDEHESGLSFIITIITMMIIMIIIMMIMIIIIK